MEVLSKWRIRFQEQEADNRIGTYTRPISAPASLLKSYSEPSTLPIISLQTLQRFRKLQNTHIQQTSPIQGPQNASKSARVFGLLAHREQEFPDVTYVPCRCGYKWCHARVSKKIASRYRRSCEALQMMFEAKKSLDGTYWERKALLDTVKKLQRKCDFAIHERDSRTQLMLASEQEVVKTKRLLEVAKLNVEKWTTERKAIKKQIKEKEKDMAFNLESMAKLEVKFSEHKATMDTQGYFVENYMIEIKEFKGAIEVFDEKARTVLPEALTLQKKIDDTQAKWNRAKKNFDEAEEQYKKFHGMYKDEEAAYDKGKGLVEGWKSNNPKIAKKDVEKHQNQLLLLSHTVEEHKAAATAADGDLYRTTRHMEQVQGGLSELELYCSAYEQDLSYWGAMLTEEAHRRMMPDTSPPTVPPSVHYQLQLYKPDEWRERRAAGQVQDLVQCPYCEAQFHCMPFVFHSSRLLKGFFDRPQEYTVVTYRPPPKTDEEIAEEEEKAAEEAKSAGSKTPEAERQKKDAEKKDSNAKAKEGVEGPLGEGVESCKVCPELFHHWTCGSRKGLAGRLGCGIVRAARHEGQWRLFGLPREEDVQVQSAPTLRLHPMTQSTGWKHRHGMPYRKEKEKKHFAGWKCGHCLALNMPERKLCKECGKEKISESALDAKKEQMEREKRKAQERAKMLADETPQARMKREAKERKEAREKKKQRQKDKQDGKTRRKDKKGGKKAVKVVQAKELLARYSDYVDSERRRRAKWQESEDERLSVYTVKMEETAQRLHLARSKFSLEETATLPPRPRPRKGGKMKKTKAEAGEGEDAAEKDQESNAPPSRHDNTPQDDEDDEDGYDVHHAANSTTFSMYMTGHSGV